MKKRIAICLIILMYLLTISITVYSFTLEKTVGDAYSFETKAIRNSTTATLTFVKQLTYGAQAIGSVIAVCVGSIIGINFMKSGAQGKADMKQALTPYTIGVVLLYGAFGIWSATISVFQHGLPMPANAYTVPIIEADQREYSSRPRQYTKIEEQEQVKGTDEDFSGGGGGSTNPTNADWTTLMSSDQQEFVQNIIDSVTNDTIKDLIIWCRDRIGYDYEGNGSPGSRDCGFIYSSHNWDQYLNLPPAGHTKQVDNCYCSSSIPDTQVHCGFDCSAFTSRAYHAVTVSPLIDDNGTRPMVFPSMSGVGANCKSGSSYWGEGKKRSHACAGERSEARSEGYIDVAAQFSGRAYAEGNRVSIRKTLKNYLQPGDILLTDGHSMMFIGFNGDDAIIIHAGGNPGGDSDVNCRKMTGYIENVTCVIRPINWTYSPAN